MRIRSSVIFCLYSTLLFPITPSKISFCISRCSVILQELAEWQAWYNKNLVNSHNQNLAHEDELQAQRDKTILLSQSVAKVNSSDSAIWERVCQLCDLTVSGNSSGDFSFSKSTAGSSSTKDVTRLRSLLLSLKNNPPRVCH